MITFDELKTVEIQVFSVSADQQTYLLHYKDVFFQVGSDVVLLMSCVKASGTEEEAVNCFHERYKETNTYSKAQLHIFIEQLKEKLTPKSVEQVKNEKMFWFSKELISSEEVIGFSKSLQFLFHKWVMNVFVFTFLLLEGYFFMNVVFELTVPAISIYTVVGLVLFFIGSSVWHELGHAAACSSFGVQHGGIGFALYINIPVFYTDVSQIWKLPRAQRCVVNIAGIYFQAILLIPFLIGYMYTYNDLLKYVIFVANLNFLVTLNPFFKFDGYWLMTDLLGIPNLRKRGNEYFVYYWDRFRGRTVRKQPFLFSLPGKIKMAFLTYTCVVNLFFAYYFFYLLPLFLVRFYDTFPAKFKQLLIELLNRRMPDWVNLQQLVVQLLFLGLTIFMLYRIVSPLIRKRKETV